MQRPSAIADRILSEARLRQALAGIDAEIDSLSAREVVLRRRRETALKGIALFEDAEFGELVSGGADDGGSQVADVQPDLGDAPPAETGGASRKVSQRSRILDVMRDVGGYMSPAEISEQLLDRFGIEAHRTTVSSQLQKLRVMGKVENTTAGWRSTVSGDASAKASPGSEGDSPS